MQYCRCCLDGRLRSGAGETCGTYGPLDPLDSYGFLDILGLADKYLVCNGQFHESRRYAPKYLILTCTSSHLHFDICHLTFCKCKSCQPTSPVDNKASTIRFPHREHTASNTLRGRIYNLPVTVDNPASNHKGLSVPPVPSYGSIHPHIVQILHPRDVGKGEFPWTVQSLHIRSRWNKQRRLLCSIAFRLRTNILL